MACFISAQQNGKADDIFPSGYVPWVGWMPPSIEIDKTIFSCLRFCASLRSRLFVADCCGAEWKWLHTYHSQPSSAKQSSQRKKNGFMNCCKFLPNHFPVGRHPPRVLDKKIVSNEHRVPLSRVYQIPTGAERNDTPEEITQTPSSRRRRCGLVLSFLIIS